MFCIRLQTLNKKGHLANPNMFPRGGSKTFQKKHIIQGILCDHPSAHRGALARSPPSEAPPEPSEPTSLWRSLLRRPRARATVAPGGPAEVPPNGHGINVRIPGWAFGGQMLRHDRWDSMKQYAYPPNHPNWSSLKRTLSISQHPHWKWLQTSRFPRFGAGIA